jgi:glycine cleavage system H lipoate-binding protein
MANQFLEDKKYCIWMEAGVIDFKFCDQDFDCQNCEFDRAMTEAAAHRLARWKAGEPTQSRKSRVGPWEFKMRRHFQGQKKCQLMQTRHCHECSFDELLEEQFDFFLAPERPKVQEVFGIKVPTSNFLHRGHTWVALENAGRVRIGLDDFSQKVLGPPDKIKLPQRGAEIQTDKAALTLCRKGNKARVLAPLTGNIEAVNPLVRKNPRLLHDDPYGAGWLFVVSPSKLKTDLERMLFGQCNISWIEHESHRLLGMLESAAGVTLPSGGSIIDDVFGAYPELGWERLTQEFLHSG